MGGQMHGMESILHKARRLQVEMESFREQMESRFAAMDQRLTQRNEPLIESPAAETTEASSQWPLPHDQYRRYGRQLIMPEIGLRGQLKLTATSVLLVGAGGLGCPAAAYLAGAGIGHIGIVDGDTVEVSNLHRQILHDTNKVGTSKVSSAIEALTRANPNIKYTAHETHLSPDNALEIFAAYDVVLDCTDNPASRYLISDCCVLLRKPLVSASALRTEGQLIVLNNPPAEAGAPGGPCYRCIFPKPPPPEAVLSCGEGGILGPVVGVMGVLQALETIKIIVGGTREQDVQESSLKTTMLIFSAYSTASPFRNVRMRGRRADCAACSGEASISLASLTSRSLDYVAFCGASGSVNLLAHEQRISAAECARARKEKGKTAAILLDVREQVQFDLCRIPDSLNVPFSTLQAWQDLNDVTTAVGHQVTRQLMENDVQVICRLGNDSQVAVQKLRHLLAREARICDVRGGLRAWRHEVDPDFPEY